MMQGFLTQLKLAIQIAHENRRGVTIHADGKSFRFARLDSDPTLKWDQVEKDGQLTVNGTLINYPLPATTVKATFLLESITAVINEASP